MCVKACVAAGVAVALVVVFVAGAILTGLSLLKKNKCENINREAVDNLLKGGIYIYQRSVGTLILTPEISSCE